MYAEIQKQTDKHSVSELCSIYGVSRSGYYKRIKRAGQLNRRRKVPTATGLEHIRYTNILNRKFKAERPLEKVVTDLAK